MSNFSPIMPFSGYSGWRFLERTIDRQQQVFNKSAQVSRDLAYFGENIAKATSAKALVADRRLLKVALGAFGLDDDINKKAYLIKVLEEGTQDKKAFANRIADKRYRAFAASFAYGNSGGAPVSSAGFTKKILEQYKVRQFEISVGENDQSLRLALSFAREMANMSGQTSTTATKWLQILGAPPLRQVFETAFGLPKSFGALDLDKQKSVFIRQTEKIIGGNPENLWKDPANIEKVLQRFFLRKQMQDSAGSSASGSIALQLLAGTGNSIENLSRSRIL